MTMRTLLLLNTILILAVTACETTPDDYDTDLGHDYFPLEIGKYAVYEVDSTIYDPTGDSMVYTTKTFFREEIVDTLTDNTGNTLYKVERFERKAAGDPWQVTKVFTRSIAGNQGIETIDNLRFIKLAFPVRENNSWDGLVHFNTDLIVTVAGESLEMFKGWSYRLESVGKPDSIGSLQFDDVALLREADEENLIELRVSREKYARGVGLVYRERWILDTQCIEACDGQSWEEKAEKGFILKQKIIGFN